MNQLSAYLQLARVDKPVGYLLLLAPVVWALWLINDGNPPFSTTMIFVFGVLLMRSAGCVVNDYIDRDLDGRVARTRTRPLARGIVSTKSALMFFSALIMCAFILVSMTNLLTIAMSSVALLLAISYPFAKRKHSLPQIHLGLAFGWAIPMAWTASVGTLSIPLFVWILYTATVLWVLAYDTIYALADRDDDIKAKIKSSAILFGQYDRLAIALLQMMFLLLMFIVGYLNNFNIFYNISLLLSGVMFIRQHQLIVRHQRELYIRAFSNNAWVGIAIFCGIVLEFVAI